MPTLERLTTFVLVTSVLMALPGPSALLAVARTVEGGRSAGLMTVAGLETGLLVHVSAAVAGVSAVLATSTTALTTLRVLGAAFFLHLAWVELRPRHASAAVDLEVDLATEMPAPAGPVLARATRGRSRLFRDGCLVDVLNPKTLLFFVVFLPQFVEQDAGAEQLLVLGLVVVSLGVVFDSGYVLAASWLVRRDPVRRRVSAARTVARVSGAAYLVAAVAALAWSA